MMYTHNHSILATILLTSLVSMTATGFALEKESAPAGTSMLEAKLTLEGQYDAVESGAKAADMINDAIESSTGRLNFIVRGKVRSKLRELTKPCPSIIVGFPSQEMAGIQCGTMTPLIASLGDEPTTMSSKDGDYHLGYELEEGKITQTFHAEAGIREDVYELNEDGTQMRVSTTIQSSWLSRPIQYSLSYTRAGQEVETAEVQPEPAER